MRVLLVSVFAPSPLRPRTGEYLRWLGRRFETDCIVQDVDGRIDAEAFRGVRRVQRVPREPRLLRLLRVGLGLLRGRPLSFFFYRSAALARAIEAIDPESYDCVIFERTPIPQSLIDRRDRSQRKPRLVVDSADCFTYQNLALARVTGGWRRQVYRLDAWLTRRFEAAHANRADHLVCANVRERRKFRRLGVTRPIDCAHMILPSGDFTASGRRTGLGEGICFHGKHSYPPNADVLRRLSSWAQVSALLRDQLIVVGKIDAHQRARLPRLRFSGYVESLGQVLAGHRLSVAPLRVSAGVPNKAIEAIYAGLPLLVTPTVLRGLPGGAAYRGRCVFVAGLADFVPALERLYADERRLHAARADVERYREDLIAHAHAGLHALFGEPQALMKRA